MTRQTAVFIDLDRTFSKILIDGDVSDDTDLNGRHSSKGEAVPADMGVNS
jgi:hypothetical protein